MNATGIVTGRAVFYHDMREHLEAQRELRASQDFARRVLESSLDWMSILDEKGVVVYSNIVPTALINEDVASNGLLDRSWVELWSREQPIGCDTHRR